MRGIQAILSATTQQINAWFLTQQPRITHTEAAVWPSSHSSKRTEAALWLGTHSATHKERLICGSAATLPDRQSLHVGSTAALFHRQRLLWGWHLRVVNRVLTSSRARHTGYLPHQILDQLTPCSSRTDTVPLQLSKRMARANDVSDKLPPLISPSSLCSANNIHLVTT